MTDIPDLDGGQPDLSFRENAQAILPAVLEAFYAQEPFGSTAPEALHQLRIAAKRLRYSMEFFENCYGKRLTNYLKSIRELQELLGNIHDCDVMIEFLQKRSSKLISSEDVAVVLSGVEQLIVDFKQRRTELAAEFAGLWQRRFKRFFKARLLRVLNNPDQQHEQI